MADILCGVCVYVCVRERERERERERRVGERSHKDQKPLETNRSVLWDLLNMYKRVSAPS